MPRFKNFIGPSYTLSNIQYENQATVNWYPEWDELVITGREQELKHLVPTPGLIPATSFGSPAPTINSRGKYTTSNGLAISIFGNQVYQVTGPAFDATIQPPLVAPLVYTSVGTLLTEFSTMNQLAFCDNGSLLVFTDGTFGYFADISDGISVRNLQQITDPTFLSYGATSCAQYYDGFFLFNIKGTNNFFWSNENQLIFSGGSAGSDSKAGNADPIVFLAVINRYLWLVGSQTSEVWYDTPSGNFIFQRITGPYIEYGCIDGNTAQKTEDGLVWVASSLRGNLQVVMTEGESTIPISTQAVVTALSKYQQSGWSSFSYGHNQHLFYQVNPPNGASSWVYDFTASAFANQSTWHERTYTDSNGVQSRHLGDNHCYFNGYHLIGDYSQPLDYYFAHGDPLQTNNQLACTDNGATITRKRRAPYVAEDSQLLYHDLLQVNCSTGVGTVIETTPALSTVEVDTVAGDAGTSPFPEIGYIDPFFASVATPLYVVTAIGTLSSNGFSPTISHIAIYNNAVTDTLTVIMASAFPIPSDFFYSLGPLLASNALITSNYDIPSNTYQTAWRWSAASVGLMTSGTTYHTFFYKVT